MESLLLAILSLSFMYLGLSLAVGFSLNSWRIAFCNFLADSFMPPCFGFFFLTIKSILVC